MTTPSSPPPPPDGAAQPSGYANNDEKTWALVAHFGGAAGMFIFSGVGGWVAPLIALLARGNQSATVRQHAVKALNFQLTWSIVGAIGYVTICILIGVVIVPIAALLGIIFGIIGGVKGSEGKVYQYPISISMIK